METNTNTLIWRSVSLPCLTQTFAAALASGRTDGQPLPLFTHEEGERVARTIVNVEPRLTVTLNETMYTAEDGQPLYTVSDNETDLYSWEIHHEDAEEIDERTIETLEGEMITPEEAEELQFCEHYEQYTSGDVLTVHIGARWGGRPTTRTFSAQAVENFTRDLYEHDGEMYDETALYYHDLCINEDTGTVDFICDCYQWEDGTYHSEEEETDARYIDSYHHRGDAAPVYFNPELERGPYLIGYEIEKEDNRIKYSVYLQDLMNEHPKWRKEKDSSLDGETGFELISPPFELDSAKIEALLSRSETLKSHINASHSTNCGGHIHLSKAGTTGRELFESIQGYTPLLHAMYPNRADAVSYCQAKSNDELKRGGKYQSVNILHNRIEIRIFSAVRNVSNLMWRTRLIELMLANPTNCPRKAFFNVHTAFKKHLMEVYTTEETFARLSARIVRYTRNFEKLDPQDGQTTLF